MDSKDLKKVEASLKKVYSQQYAEVKSKFDIWYAKNSAKISELNKQLWNGEISPTEHLMKTSEISKLLNKGKSTSNDILSQIASMITNANKIANDHINGSLPKFYGNGLNDAGQDVHSVLSAYSFTLVDQKTITMMADAQPKLLPTIKTKIPKDLEWNRKKLAAEVTQGLLQGESSLQISKRLKAVFQMNQNSAIRNARTMVTCAENKGRLAGYKQAEEKGVILHKKWIATRDGRTRDSHAMLDGQTVPVGKKFSNGLMYPGDTDWGRPEEVYNCRCTIGTVVVGFKHYEPKTATESNKKIAVLEEKKNKALQNQALAKQKLDDFEESYKGIEYDDIFYAKTVKPQDYPLYKSKVAQKEQYFQDALIYADESKKAHLTEQYDQLKHFVESGKEYEALSMAVADAKMEIKSIEDEIEKILNPQKSIEAFSAELYTEQNKNAAKWFKGDNKGMRAYNEYIDEASRWWLSLSDEERDAMYNYTGEYSIVNMPLRGWNYDTDEYLGLGNIDFEAQGTRWHRFERGESLKRIKKMTSAIDKTSYPYDIWLNRGVKYERMDKFFGVSIDLLENGTEEQLKAALLGTTPTEYAFMSAGVAKGDGFTQYPIILNVYAPRGTKMAYIEPISQYGNGSGRWWDGKTRQKDTGYENEMLLQRETTFRITKVERNNGKLWIDMEVIGQERKVNKLE